MDEDTRYAATRDAVATPPEDKTTAEYWKRQHDELLHNLETWGVIEIAIRNPSVAEYMRHWEQRTEKAEALLDRIVEALYGRHERGFLMGPLIDRENQIVADVSRLLGEAKSPAKQA